MLDKLNYMYSYVLQLTEMLDSSHDVVNSYHFVNLLLVERRAL